MLVRAALAGGIASGSTTLLMYPLDTLKTRVQSTVGASIADVVRTVPQIGLRGLYRSGTHPLPLRIGAAPHRSFMPRTHDSGLAVGYTYHQAMTPCRPGYLLLEPHSRYLCELATCVIMVAAMLLERLTRCAGSGV